ncbi:MAG TPA: class F sortase [Ilumatobacteraceae bacterium]|nr:class F sortase [Ilumatobacteraceae bacterium]
MISAVAVLVLVGGVIIGALVVLVSGASSSAVDIDELELAAVTSAVGSTVPSPPSPTTSLTSSEAVMSTSTTPATTTTTTTTTIVPIVTHLADIGVLAPNDVIAPTRVIIPGLEIDGPVIPAGVNAENELDVPPDARTLVWYRHGPSPGGRGSAVIAGHLNWRGVNGLFARLADTPVGATITVVYDDGSEQAFTVSTVELVPKPAVSVSGVFARDGEPLLRLVTCGGEFEAAVRSYRSNVIVTAIPA